MSTAPERTGNASVPEATGSKGHRRTGLTLLLAGLVLAFGGFALPWLSVTCTANCANDS